MKKLQALRSICFVITCLLSIAIAPLPANSAFFRLDPGGRLLDDDPRKDLTISDDDHMAFDIFFLDKNLGNPATQSFDLQFVADPLEISMLGFFPSLADVNPVQAPAIMPCGPNLEFECASYLAPKNSLILFKPLLIKNEIWLGFLLVKSVDVEEWPGNGESDLQIFGNHYDKFGFLIGVVQSDDLEVQEVQEVPGPVPLLGVVAFASRIRYLRNLSRRISNVRKMKV